MINWYSEGQYLNPLFTRMNDHFVLADFMYNDSVIRKGDVNFTPQNRVAFPNVLYEHFEEMAEYSERLVDRLGPCSVSYGYISEQQSERRVKWKNPKSPSYHRWDDGCAADFLFHNHVWGYGWGTSPHLMSMMIIEAMDSYEFSRIITYSESPWICVGTGLEGRNRNRKALYWNVYEGVSGAKPKYVRFTLNEVEAIRRYGDTDLVMKKIGEVKEIVGTVGWAGGGYPSSHGGGIRQAHHIRLGDYVMLSDVLRNPQNIYSGLGGAAKHCRPPSSQVGIDSLKIKVSILDDILKFYYGDQFTTTLDTPDNSRVSILSAYGGPAYPFSRFFDGFDGVNSMLNWSNSNAEFILSVTSGNESYNRLLSCIEYVLTNHSFLTNTHFSHSSVGASVLINFGFRYHE